MIKVKCLPSQVTTCTIAFRALFNPSRPKKDIPHCLLVLTVNDLTTTSKTPTLAASDTYNLCLAHHIGATDKESYGSHQSEAILSLEKKIAGNPETLQTLIMMMTHTAAKGPQKFLFTNVDHMVTNPGRVVFTFKRVNQYIACQVIEALPLVLKTLVDHN